MSKAWKTNEEMRLERNQNQQDVKLHCWRVVITRLTDSSRSISCAELIGTRKRPGTRVRLVHKCAKRHPLALLLCVLPSRMTPLRNTQ
ncbi:hypothetical protein L596_020406 [Steinernema carpocapsae]|uniref:Uncharacterized protein n=1 Tax=Steinernema carpocapsae TaxID=34508 RepID=A0A4U5MTJ1_STECR|nr:hypothetical protein L596_020406 [Steinernema carpocapsae]